MVGLLVASLVCPFILVFAVSRMARTPPTELILGYVGFGVLTHVLTCIGIATFFSYCLRGNLGLIAFVLILLLASPLTLCVLPVGGWLLTGRAERVGWLCLAGLAVGGLTPLAAAGALASRNTGPLLALPGLTALGAVSGLLASAIFCVITLRFSARHAGEIEIG